MKHFILCALMASPVFAQTPMTGDQFETYVLGKTYTYSSPGIEPYGIEAYRPNRQVTWAYFNDTCYDGYWYEAENNAICFVYPYTDEHKCWLYYKAENGLRAEFLSDALIPTYDVTLTTQSVPCLGPEVGA